MGTDLSLSTELEAAQQDVGEQGDECRAIIQLLCAWRTEPLIHGSYLDEVLCADACAEAALAHERP